LTPAVWHWLPLADVPKNEESLYHFKSLVYTSDFQVRFWPAFLLAMTSENALECKISLVYFWNLRQVNGLLNCIKIVRVNKPYGKTRLMFGIIDI